MSFALNIHADTVKLNGLTFITGSDTAVVKSYTEIPADGKLTIPSEITSEGKAYKVTAINNSAFMTCAEITELTICKELKYIEDYAFSNCINLKKITLEQGDDELYLDKESFVKCPIEEINMGRYLSRSGHMTTSEYLKKVTISDNIKLITYGLFSGSSIEEINLKNVETIDGFAFYECRNLKNVDISNVIKIGTCAFCQTGLQKVTISTCTKKISSEAFSSCADLSTVEILGNPEIGISSFSNCQNLEKVTLSDDIYSIPSEVFKSCKGLKTINLSNITIIESNAFSGCSSLEEVEFGSIKTIGNSAFENTNLKNLSFGESLSEIKSRAFSDCKNLTNIDLSLSNLSTLDYYTFRGCEKLESINLPSCLKEICPVCFAKCKSLKKIDLSKTNVTTIPNSCFDKCTELTEVYLNEATDSIFTWAFNNCSNLAIVKNSDNILYVGKDAFLETAFLSSFTEGEVIIGKVLYKYVGEYNGDNYEITDDISSVTSEALKGQNFKTIKIGKNVKTIGNDALSDCKSILSLTIPETIIDFGNISGCDNLVVITFKSGKDVLKTRVIDCPSLTKMYLGRNIKIEDKYNVPSLSNLTVGEYAYNLDAFSKCEKLTTLDLEDSDMEIDLRAIDRTKVTDLYMGRNICNHEGDAFRRLSRLSIGNKVTYIPNKFMQQSYNEGDNHTIKEIVIPSNVKKIGTDAFSQLNSNTIERIELNEGLEEIGQNAFGFCSNKNIGDFRIPSTVKKVEMMAFCGLKCNKLEIPEGVGYIGVDAFYKLETDSVTLPSTARLCHESFAFSKLKYVDASRITCKNLECSFIYNFELEKIILPKNIEEIGENEFWYCKKLDGIEIPKSVSKIGQNALVGTKQKTFIIPSNVKEICGQYFEDTVDKAVLDIQSSANRDELYLSGSFSNIGMIKTDRSIKSVKNEWTNDDYLYSSLRCDTLVIGANCDYIRYENLDDTNIDIPIVYNLSRNVVISNVDNNKTKTLYVLPESKDIALGGKELISVINKEYESSEDGISFNYINNTLYNITPLFYKDGVMSDFTT